MSLTIDRLTGDRHEQYEDWLRSLPDALLFHSSLHRRFLERIVEGESHYLLALRGHDIVGALPAFVRPGVDGAVINSLPFYGSNGGLLVADDEPERAAVESALLAGWDDLHRAHDAVVSTLVTNPLDADAARYEVGLQIDLRDRRIGQLTPLPEPGSTEEVQEHLLRAFHVKTRNMVRKGLRSGFSIGHDGGEDTLRRLAAIHTENMAAIGGAAKPWPVFEAVRDVFTYDRDYRVYTAERDGRTSAALLVFYYNRTAEYYTPATVEAERSLQPMSALIFEAMQEAVRRGMLRWNWGGTWSSQDGVHRFKKRWGTEDRDYHYLTRVADRGILQRTPEELLARYPYYFVVPFAALESACAE